MICDNATSIASSHFVDRLNKKVSNVWFEVTKDIETAVSGDIFKHAKIFPL